MKSTKAMIEQHYFSCWNAPFVRKNWQYRPTSGLPNDFHVLEFAPRTERRMWTYATCGMSNSAQSSNIELHLFSPLRSELHVELLFAICHFHCTASPLDVGHTINFGRTWLPNSSCSYGLISLPYLDGPALEFMRESEVRFLWLLPITESERIFKASKGIEELEARFDDVSVNYLDPFRPSVV